MLARLHVEVKPFAAAPINPNHERMPAWRKGNNQRLSRLDETDNHAINLDLVGSRRFWPTRRPPHRDGCLVDSNLYDLPFD